MGKRLAGEALLRKSCLVVAAIAALGCAPAKAWGDLGHKVTALVAYRHLTAQARSKLDALLAADTDSLTPPDFASRATWADKYRAIFTSRCTPRTTMIGAATALACSPPPIGATRRARPICMPTGTSA
jgi:S1/P1 Nuclease